MTNPIKATMMRFIEADIGNTRENKQPAIDNPGAAVILTFGGEEGPIEVYAVSVNDARDMVVDMLAALAQIGDELALEIGNKYFTKEDG